MQVPPSAALDLSIKTVGRFPGNKFAKVLFVYHQWVIQVLQESARCRLNDEN